MRNETTFIFANIVGVAEQNQRAKPSKSSKQYLLEGLIIFLVVTLSFLADNDREGLNQKEIRSPFKKTKADFAKLKLLN